MSLWFMRLLPGPERQALHKVCLLPLSAAELYIVGPDEQRAM